MSKSSAALFLKLASFNVPVSFKYSQLSGSWTQIQNFKPFQNWVGKWERTLQEGTLNADAVDLQGILIEDINYFGSEKIGFLKFTLDAKWKADGTRLPGIVFMRGDAVAVLLLLKDADSPKAEAQVVLVRQPRLAVPTLDFWELPAGMIDNDSFKSAATKELSEECGIEIHENEMISLGDPIATSAGACDEFLQIFLVEKSLPKKELDAIEGRLGGLLEHGERIRLSLIPLSKLYKTSPTMIALAGLTLYNEYVKSKAMV